MDCIVHGVAKSRTGLSNFHFTSLQCLTPTKLSTPACMLWLDTDDGDKSLVSGN